MIDSIKRYGILYFYFFMNSCQDTVFELIIDTPLGPQLAIKSNDETKGVNSPCNCG